MPTPLARYSPEETAQRGGFIYEQDIRSEVETKYPGKVVAIDIETHAYSVADNAVKASKELLAQNPDAEVWCVRVGQRTLHHIGLFHELGNV